MLRGRATAVNGRPRSPDHYETAHGLVQRRVVTNRHLSQALGPP
jgi:hypothetical protein